VSRLAANTTTPASLAAPGWTPRKGVLEALRRRRDAARVCRALYGGDWRCVLLDGGRTQHRFQPVRRFSGQTKTLLEKVNLVKVAMRVHAKVLAARAVSIDTPAGFDEQLAAIAGIRDRSHFDARYHEAALRLQMDGCAVFRAEQWQGVTPAGEHDFGARLRLEKPGRVFAMERDTADGQPSVYETRWVVERRDAADRNKTKRFLRVQRERVPDGRSGAVIEQEAYESASDNVLQDLTKLKRVPLASAFEAGATVPPEIQDTNLPLPPLAELAASRMDDEPELLIDEHGLDLIDRAAKSFSDLSRSADEAGYPKKRVPSTMVDAKTGHVDSTQDSVIDPHKEFEYLVLPAGQLTQVAEVLNIALDWALVELEVARSLVGFKGAAGSASPETYEKMLLDATATLDRAHMTARYCDRPLGSVFTLASIIDSRMPMRGYAVAPVRVRSHPGVTKPDTALATEQAELLQAGLTSQHHAVAAIHGDENAEAVLAEIRGDDDRKAKQAAASLGASLGFMGAPGSNPGNSADAAGGEGGGA